MIWHSAPSMEAKDGSFGFDFAGTYTKIVPNQLIEYSFEGRAGVVEFLPAKKGVTMRVTFDAETTNPEEQQRQGWRGILNNLLNTLPRRTNQKHRKPRVVENPETGRPSAK